MEYRKQQFDTYDAFTQQFSCDYSKPLARGGHGEIYRGVDLETNEEVAIKRRLYSPDSDLITLEKEYTHTQALPPNRFVVRYVYYGRYATPFGTFEFLVMKFYRDGNLTHNALPWHRLTEAQKRRFTEEFLKGLAHLHRHQVIHRDIKPENILLVKYIDADGAAYRPVIADFGISKLLSENPEAHTLMQNSMRVGTVTYMAPEQLRALSLSYNADLWSFGIILYEIITGKYMIPRRSFPDLQREEAYTFWRNADEQRFPADMNTIPEPYQQIIRRCLLADPTERVQSTDELLALLSVQPQLVEVDQLIKAGQTAEAIEVLESIESRASLPLASQKLNELRLQQSLAKPIEDTGLPLSDRPVVVEEDDEAIAPLPVVQTVPPTASRPALPDDDQRTQQFTEQLGDAWPLPLADRPPVSPLAQFRNPDAAPAEPVPGSRSAEAQPAPLSAETDTVVAEAPTPEKPLADQADLITDRPVTTAFEGSPVESESGASAETSAAPEPAVSVARTEQTSDQMGSQEPATEAFAEPQPVGEPVAEQAPEPPLVTPPAAPVVPPKPLVPPIPVRSWADTLGRQSKRLYQRVNASPHKRLILLTTVAIVLAFVLLYSSDSSGPTPPTRQTSPAVSEDYRKALQLFKVHQLRYEKTGELNPYLWAFEHCNPDYSDSLEVRSAITRAQAMAMYTQLLFPEAETNLTGFKRQEMRHILVSKGSWEKLPHDLNCAPGELLEDQQNN